ncbi:MAG TPA: TonB-dependent receptor [Bacteroidia bacterium]|nr:TonB-dependent receptor [Bacteroidia bacterium]
MRFLPLFLLFLFPQFLSASSVKGKVTDAENKPMEFVVVTLLRAQDSSLVKGAVTDQDGAFSFDAAAGKYLVCASFTGYTKTWNGPFDVTDGQDLTVNDIVLQASKELDAVTISDIQPLYIQKPDKLIMNVENSPVRITGTAWDLVTTAPGVSVDNNNNISLRGKSGVKVYIDGRNTYLSGDQLVSYLQNISAADVVQVEIISNPSAKYDAEGSGGIINVITRKGSQQGLNGTIRPGIGQGFYTRYEFGADFNYAKEKFNVYGKYFFANSNNANNFNINRNVPYDGITTNFNQHSFSGNVPLGHRVSLGVDFYAKHNITWGGRIDAALAGEKDYTQNSTVISVAGSDTSSLLYQVNHEKSFYNNGAANLYFSQKYDTLGKELSASADYLAYQIGSHNDFDLNYYDNFGNHIAPEEFQRNISYSDIRIFVGQVDYSNPFGRKYKMETGLKSSYVQTYNDLHFDLLDSSSSWFNDTTKSNRFIYREQINAAYVNGYADFGRWQFEAGLRAEQTISDGNSPTTGEHLHRTYAQLFPSVFILEKLDDKNSLNYTYSHRINRPSYQDLNPFTSYLDKYTYEKGNPFLQPEIADNAEFTYSYLDALFVTLGGSRTKFAMTDVTQQVDSTAIGYKTTVNLDNVYSGYFGVSCPVPIGKWFMMENDLNLSYNQYKSDLFGTLVDNKSWMFNGSSNLTFRLPQEWKLQLWGWYNSPGTYGIFRMKARGGVGGGISKTMLNRQLQFNLTVQDLFRTTGMHATINFQNQDAYVEFRPDSPRVYLRVRYSFGNSKATRKAQSKTGADDLKDRTGK